MSSDNLHPDTTQKDHTTGQLRPKSPASIRDSTREAFLASNSIRNTQHLRGKANVRLEVSSWFAMAEVEDANIC
jgi:hypothetical protein